MDLLPTFAAWAGVEVKSNRPIDGRDIGPLILGSEGARSPHEVFYYYERDQLQAVRSGPWKLFVPLEEFSRHPHFAQGDSGKPLLFHVVTDIGSRTNVAEQHPEVVARLMKLANSARAELGDRGRTGSGMRSPGKIDQPVPQVLGE